MARYNPPDPLELSIPRPYVALDNLSHRAGDPQLFATLDRAMTFTEYVLTEVAKTTPTEQLFPNNLAALSTLFRAYQSIQAATCLTVLGFTTEARTVARSAYESMSLSRTMAKDVPLAESWLLKNVKVPNRVARDYSAALHGGDEDAKIPYAQYYRNASSYAHPSALASLPFLLDLDGDVVIVNGKCYPSIDTEIVDGMLQELIAESICLAYSVRNALADPDVLEPEWHTDLASLAREFTGDPMEHLDDDWEARRRRHEKLQGVARTDDLEAELRTNPRSVDNLLGHAHHENRPAASEASEDANRSARTEAGP